MALRRKLGPVTALVTATGLLAAGLVTPASAVEGPVEAGITVPKVEGMGVDWINGVDISSVLSLEDSGVVFRDKNGDEADLFDVLADHDVNWVRVRVWNDPWTAEKQGYGGGNTDADRATEIAERATEAGMRVLVNFHYSDFWADPGKWMRPKAWEGMDAAQVAQAVGEYTSATLQQMKAAGVDVGMVQVGNETNGGRLAGVSGWADTGPIFAAGADAVRDEFPDALVAVHWTDPHTQDYVAAAQELQDAGVDYDVFASSYYPFWHGTLDNLTAKLTAVAEGFDKDVMVAETSWAYTLEDGDGHENTVNSAFEQYSISVQGQALAIRDVMQAVADVDNGRGIGTFYWEPAWLPVGPPEDVEANKVLWERDGSGWATSFAGEYDAEDAGQWYGGSSWDNQALFDFDGYPLESLNVYQYAVTGSVGSLEVDTVSAPPLSVVDGDTWNLPATVTVTYTDGSSEQEPVTWHAQPAWMTGAGTYEVSGTSASGLDAQLTVTVLAGADQGRNWVDNPGFEDGTAPWTATGDSYNISAHDDPYEGSRSTHWSANDGDTAFTISQEITGVPAGDYRLSAWAQGSNAAAGDSMSITLSAGDQSASALFVLAGWQNWEHPRTDIVSIAPDQTVTVSANFELTGGAWGTIDLFELIEVTPLVETDLAALEQVQSDGQAIDRDGWSAGTLHAFDTAMVRAAFVLAAPDPSQDAVDNAADALEQAILGLELDDGSVPDPTVLPVEMTVIEGDDVALPDTVTVKAFDDSTTTESVTWNDVLDLITSPGEYTVTGVTEGGWTATATVTVTARNWILNPGFEQGWEDISPWELWAEPWPETDVTGFYGVADSSDAIGTYALNPSVASAANGGVPFEYSAMQQITGLEPGVYEFSGSLMGADEGEGVVWASLKAETTVDEYWESLEFLGWPDWHQATTLVTVPADGEVWVGVNGEMSFDDWAWIDEFSLIRVDDAEGVDTTQLESAIADAGKVDRSAYTAESLAALDLEVERGAIVLAASIPTQDQVDTAVAAIAAAITALVEVEEPEDPDPTPSPEPTPVPTPEPTDPDDGDGGDNDADSIKMQVSATTVRPGDEVTITVTGATGTAVEFGVQSEYQRLATATVVDGTATATVTIPTNLEPGIHHLLARDGDGTVLAQVEITVLAADASDEALSRTGVSTLMPVAVAALLLTMGLVLAVRARRQRA